MQFKLKKIAALLFGVGISLSVFAEDIELYVNHNVETDENPRVLIILILQEVWEHTLITQMRHV